MAYFSKEQNKIVLSNEDEKMFNECKVSFPILSKQETEELIDEKIHQEYYNGEC